MARRLGLKLLGRLARSFAAGAAGFGEASSVYPACQNLLLVARANGLGATLTIWHVLGREIGARHCASARQPDRCA